MKSFFALAITLLSTSPARAQTPLPLATFEQYALAASPSLRQAQARAETSAALAHQAGLLPNPSIGYQGEQIRGGAFRGGEQGGFIEQKFPLGGKLGLRRQVFAEQAREDRIGIQEQRERILADVDTAFYTTLAAQQTVNARRKLLAIAQDTVATTRELANIGQAQAPDVLEAEIQAEQARIALENAQSDYTHKFRALAVIAAKPELPVAPLAGDLENPPGIDTGRILDAILQHSPAIRRAQQEMVRLEAALKSAQRENAPDLDIHAGLQNNNEPLGLINGPAIGVQGFVTAGLTLPLFNRNQGNIAAIQSEIEGARAEVSRLELALRQEAQPALECYLAAKAQAASYKQIAIPQAARAYQLYLASYEQMSVSYAQVLISERTLSELQLAYIDALQRMWTGAIALQHFLIGGSTQ
jgi:cobalt-zinc-cadmium efflux system outer membrane protein